MMRMHKDPTNIHVHPNLLTFLILKVSCFRSYCFFSRTIYWEAAKKSFFLSGPATIKSFSPPPPLGSVARGTYIQKVIFPLVVHPFSPPPL